MYLAVSVYCREQRSGNTLYQELSFQDAEALGEMDEGADITGIWFATVFIITNSVAAHSRCGYQSITSYFISVVFGGSVTGSQTCLVIVAWHCDGNCHLAL